MSEIRSRVATDQYRANWDRIFGKKPVAIGNYVYGHDGFKGQNFAPAEIVSVDPDDHPKAD